MVPAIVCLDLDPFAASVEQLKNPALRGRPVIVGQGVVASCSADARRFGVRSGMPVRQAMRLCPHASLFEGNPHSYARFSDAVWSLVRRRLPHLEAGFDTALAILPTSIDSPLRLARELHEEIRRDLGLTAAVGVAPTRLVARMAAASARPGGIVLIPPGSADDFLADRPVGELPGVGAAEAALLREMEILRVRDLRALPGEELEAMFARRGWTMYERARGFEPAEAMARAS